MQVEKHALVEQRFDLATRRGAEGLDGAAALADDDALLAVALDVQHGPNIYPLGALPELIDLTRHAVRQLFMQLLEGRFADEFRGKEPQRLGGKLSAVVMKRALGQATGDLGQECVDALPRGGGRENFRRPDGRPG